MTGSKTRLAWPASQFDTGKEAKHCSQASANPWDARMPAVDTYWPGTSGLHALTKRKCAADILAQVRCLSRPAEQRALLCVPKPYQMLGAMASVGHIGLLAGLIPMAVPATKSWRAPGN